MADRLRLRLHNATVDALHRGYDRVRTLGAIGPDTERGRRFAKMGAGSCISFPYGSIYGEQVMEIGEGTMIGAHVTLSAGLAPGLDLGTEPILRIGANVVLGRGSHIVAHRSIEIGDDVFTGPYIYVTDQNHVYADPDQPIGRQWPVENPVRIGSGSWLGTGVVVLPGADIGRNVVVAAGSVVRGTIPDHSVVAGSPAKVVRRWTREEGWQPALPPSAQRRVEDLSPRELAILEDLLADSRPSGQP